jgi:hypothetical protein
MTQNCRGRYCEPGGAPTGAAQAHEKREAVRRRQRAANGEEEANDGGGLFGGLFIRIRGGGESDRSD